jgi:RNA polymerase subunit RPABC4/transcription elongation factor Spt4
MTSSNTIVAVKNSSLVLTCAKCSGMLQDSGDLCSKCGYTTFKVGKFSVAVVTDGEEEAPSLEEVRTFIKEQAEQREADKKRKEEELAAAVVKEARQKKLFLLGMCGAAALILLIVVVSQIVAAFI